MYSPHVGHIYVPLDEARAPAKGQSLPETQPENRSQKTPTCLRGTEERRTWSWKCEEARSTCDHTHSRECERNAIDLWYHLMTLLQLSWGDLLRSVPCVTVWHQKIISWIPCAREKSIKVYFLYVPRIIKNIRGHLPDLIRKDEKFFIFWYVTLWHWLFKITSEGKKLPIKYAKTIYKSY